jgi:hypothetical protein
MRKYTCRAILVLLIILPSYHAFAGPPFITDDPEPVEAQHWEVNFAVNKTWHEGGASAGIPSIDINYGLSPDAQIHAQPRYADESTGNEKHFGIDNTEIGMKYRFINEQYENSSWMASIYPIIQLPTGGSRLSDSSGKVQTFLPLWIQRNSENWTFYGGFGYRLNNYAESKDSWFSGAAVLYRLSHQWQLGGEIFHETTASIGGRGQTGYNLGGIYNLSNAYHILFSAGQGLSNATTTNQFSTYLALQVTY